LSYILLASKISVCVKGLDTDSYSANHYTPSEITSTS